MRVVPVLGVVLLSVVLLGAVSSESARVMETACAYYNARTKRETTSLEEGHRAYALLAALQVKTPGLEALPLCVWEDRSLSVARSCCYPFKKPVLAMSRYTLENFSDLALIGALAHELGHILIGKPSSKIPREAEMVEQATDAAAIELAGAEALRATYAEHTGDAALAERRVQRALLILSHQAVSTLDSSPLARPSG